MLRIDLDDLTRPQVHTLLEEHLRNMCELSPPESVFALDLSKLRSKDITFWTAWNREVLVDCGALKELDARHGEVKSMRTPAAIRRTGAGRAILERIVQTAKERGYQRLSLETGTHPAFLAAHSLYESAGFKLSSPFGDYKEDPHSAFMALELRDW